MNFLLHWLSLLILVELFRSQVFIDHKIIVRRLLYMSFSWQTVSRAGCWRLESGISWGSEAWRGFTVASDHQKSKGILPNASSSIQHAANSIQSTQHMPAIMQASFDEGNESCQIREDFCRLGQEAIQINIAAAQWLLFCQLLYSVLEEERSLEERRKTALTFLACFPRPCTEKYNIRVGKFARNALVDLFC